MNKVENEADDIKIPDYLKLAPNDYRLLKEKISSYYVNLRKFYSNKLINNLLIAVQQKCSNLLFLINSTPYFSEIKYDGNTEYSIFDKETTYLIFKNYFLLALNEYVKLSTDINMTMTMTMTRREYQDQDEDQENNGDGNELETVDNLEDMNSRYEPLNVFQKGNLKDLKNNTVELMEVFLGIMNQHKSIASLSYENIMDYVFKRQEKEKNKITDVLKTMTEEERNVNTVMKKNKLGDWGKGLQKSLTVYTRDRSDEERDEMEQHANMEKQIIRKNMDMDDFEQEEDALRDEEEEYSLRNLTENYTDGVDYEGDEHEEENYGEYD